MLLCMVIGFSISNRYTIGRGAGTILYVGESIKINFLVKVGWGEYLGGPYRF